MNEGALAELLVQLGTTHGNVSLRKMKGGWRARVVRTGYPHGRAERQACHGTSVHGPEQAVRRLIENIGDKRPGHGWTPVRRLSDRLTARDY